MAPTMRRWLILGTALAASVVVAIVFRPVDTLGENPIVRRDDKVNKVVQRLSTILQPEEISISNIGNPFQKPGEPVTNQPNKGHEKPQTAGVQMTGWVKLNNQDYALIATANGERYVQVGDRVADWLVTQVTPEQTIFTRNGVQDVVKLKDSFSVTPLR